MTEIVNSSNDPRSRLFGSQRMFDLDSLERWAELDLPPLWPSEERKPDPKAYIVRQVIANHLKPQHREVLEGFYFEGRTITELAAERGVTRRAVTAMIQRAEKAFRRELLAHAQDYRDVPEEER